MEGWSPVVCFCLGYVLSNIRRVILDENQREEVQRHWGVTYRTIVGCELSQLFNVQETSLAWELRQCHTVVL